MRGPMFRYERPQKGRSRQFHQFDVEALGFAGPDVDAEQIVMLARLWKALGLAVAPSGIGSKLGVAPSGTGSKLGVAPSGTGSKNYVELHVNSIGDPADRKAHREKLIAYFERHASILDDAAKRRLQTNPLRILDSKNPAMQAMIEDAPMPIDHLGEDARRHFGGLQDLLARAGLQFRVNPRIVRGLDYYNRTVFEWISPLVGAQSTIAGGGRYDALFGQLGGKPTPACGFAFGIERVILAMQASGAKAGAGPDAFVVHAGEEAQACAWRVSERLRDARLDVVFGSGGSFKSQMKRADASGAAVAVIIGEDEVKSDKVTVKPLRGGDQQTMALDEAIAFISKFNA